MATCKCGKKARWMSNACDECLDAQVTGAQQLRDAQEAAEARVAEIERIARGKVGEIERMVSTGNDLPGYRLTRALGIVRGASIRGRAPLGSLMGTLQTAVGAEVTSWMKASEQARKDAMLRMCEEAVRAGANGIIGVRFDKEDVAAGGVMEVLCYGTAVTVEPVEGKGGAE